MSESQEQVKVVFTPSGKRGHFAFETPVKASFQNMKLYPAQATFHRLPKLKSAGKELKRSHSMADV